MTRTFLFCLVLLLAGCGVIDSKAKPESTPTPETEAGIFWSSDQAAPVTESSESRTLITQNATKGGVDDTAARLGRKIGKYYYDSGCLPQSQKDQTQSQEQTCASTGEQALCSVLYLRNVTIGREIQFTRLEPKKEKWLHYVAICREFLNECINFWAQAKVPGVPQSCVDDFNTCATQCSQKPEPVGIF